MKYFFQPFVYIKLVENKAIAINGDSKDYSLYEFEDSAFDLILLIKDGATREELLECLLENYEISPEQAESDLQEFLNSLEEIKLLITE